MDKVDLVGVWKSEYYYGEGQSSKHILEIAVGNSGIWVGRGKAADGSILTLNMGLDASRRILTGTFHEATSPRGEYKGAEFFGAVQFILDEGYTSGSGKWVGFNLARDKVNTGVWKLDR